MAITCEVTVPWKMGVHIRPATSIVKLLQNFSSEIELSKNGTVCNAKSVMQLLTLDAAHGEKITVSAKGKDAQEALEALQKLFMEYKEDHEGEISTSW